MHSAFRPASHPWSFPPGSERVPGRADSRSTSSLRHRTKSLHLHTLSAVIGCLVALQWLDWPTFFIALGLLSSVAFHLHLVAGVEGNEAPYDYLKPSTPGSRESSHPARAG
jgi:hypothetical protein